jgi:hypothetical protein
MAVGCVFFEMSVGAMPRRSKPADHPGCWMSLCFCSETIHRPATRVRPVKTTESALQALSVALSVPTSTSVNHYSKVIGITWLAAAQYGRPPLSLGRSYCHPNCTSPPDRANQLKLPPDRACPFLHPLQPKPTSRLLRVETTPVVRDG